MPFVRRICYNHVVKKPKVQNLFLYRHRYGIGYTVLGLILVSVLLLVPLVSPRGLSQPEIDSALTSYYDTPASLIDLPYHLLQKGSIMLFGLTTYAIKLPSILVGILLGLMLTLLLTRWFKNNVALLASIMMILSAPFLYLAGTGTPLIMIVFWPTLLLWAGSRIQGEKKPRPHYCFLFALALLASLFTPYMLYFALFAVIFVLASPHLRFVVKSLPKVVLIFAGLFTTAGVAMLIISFCQNPHSLQALLGTESFTWGSLGANLQAGLAPFFFTQTGESLWLSPMLGIATVALALVGLFSTVHGFFASRNALASCLIVASVIFTALNPNAAMLLILPMAILVAHGLRYVLERWYGLFPENPYARVFALFPVAIFVGLVLYSNLTNFIYGYHYTPTVANQFSDDLELVRANLLNADQPTTLVIPQDEQLLRFYQIIPSSELAVVQSLQEVQTPTFATLGAGNYLPAEADGEQDDNQGRPDGQDNNQGNQDGNQNGQDGDKGDQNGDQNGDQDGDQNGQDAAPELIGIITSPNASESDRIYIYNSPHKEE